MDYKQITRINPKTGNLERPWRNRDHFFVLGDPAIGAVKHHDENAVKVDNYGEALELVQKGHSIRMADGRSSPSLVTPPSLRIVDEPYSCLDDLWTYTMPELPFSRQELEKDIRRTLVAEAAEISCVANSETARAFIGFDFDLDSADDPDISARIDLSRFNFARVVFNAFESAFRTGAAKLISDEDIDELEIMIGALVASPCRRFSSPVDRRMSPLQQTMQAAYLRWQIAEGVFLIEDKLDQSAVASFSALTGMTDQAVRNSLNKQGISAVKGKIEYRETLRWLENRRQFFPLREDERPNARITWEAIHFFKTLSVPKAFVAVRDRSNALKPGPEMNVSEARIAEHDAAGSIPSPSVLRQYARDLGLNIDTFVMQFSKLARAKAK